MSIFTMLFITILTFIIGIIIGLRLHRFFQMKELDKYWGNKEYILEGGEKKALVLYEPSKHNKADKLNRLLAETLQKQGYEVTVNYLCRGGRYSLEEYEVISLGNHTYMGKISSSVGEYLKKKRPVRKKLIFFMTGMFPYREKEFKEIVEKVEEGNEIFCIKGMVNETEEIEEMIKGIFTS